MLANQQLDRDFSLIIPTRERPEKIQKCLLSFFNSADRKHNNEAVVLVDHDDNSWHSLTDFIAENELNVRIIAVWQSKMMIRDYNNYGAQCSLAKYVWILNDDYEMTTPHWDTILKRKIKDFTETNGDEIAYVAVDDSTHSEANWNCMDSMGCCCPILTREAVEAMNAAMPWQLPCWGADVYLWKIFKGLPVNRIIDATRDVRVLHHCVHNKTADADHIQDRVKSISGASTHISEEERKEYTDKLLSRVNFLPKTMNLNGDEIFQIQTFKKKFGETILKKLIDSLK